MNEQDEFERSARFFHTWIEALKKEPRLRFVMDQVPLMRPYLERYPEDLPFIKTFLDEGLLELVNGWYHEPDVNIPGGEGLARCAVLGQRWQEKVFGRRAHIGWNIDCFGQPDTMPQILLLSDIDRAILMRGPAAKPVPATEFYWVGPDGSKILTHYMSQQYTCGAWVGKTDKLEGEFELIEWLFKTLGKVAAGKAILAPAGRDFMQPHPFQCKTVSAWNETHPENQIEISTPGKFFNEVEKERDKLREFADEVTRHGFCATGTWSFRIGLKQSYRKCEFSLLAAERLETLTALIGNDYDEKRYSSIWEKLCLNQFHDAITGCGTDIIYLPQIKRYEQVSAFVDERVETNLSYLASKINTLSLPQTEKTVPIIAFNPLNFPREELVIFSPGEIGLSNTFRLEDEKGSEIAYQRLKEHDQVAFWAELPSLGYRTYCARAETEPTINPEERISTGKVLESDLLLVELDDDGNMNRLFDCVAKREILDPDAKRVVPCHSAVVSPFRYRHGKKHYWTVHLAHSCVDLNRDKSLKAIRLPNHFDLKILSLTLDAEPQDISKFFNADGISTEKNPEDCLMYDQQMNRFEDGRKIERPVGFPAEMLPQNARLECPQDGVTFNLGPWQDGSMNMISCQGQTIPLADNRQRLHLLALSSWDNYDGPITVIYGDGTEEELYLFVEDWRSTPLPIVNAKSANLVQTFEDIGNPYVYGITRQVGTTEKTQASVEIRSGPVLTRGIATSTIEGSHFRREIRLVKKGRRIDFVTDIDWKGSDRTVIVSFPLSSKGERSEEVPFGFKARPDGTFPVQTWSEWGTSSNGVALLNRGLPACNLSGGQLSLTLFRSLSKGALGDVPSETGLDRRKHRFEYALYVHNGSWQAAQVPQAGWAFNSPILLLTTGIHRGSLPVAKSFLQTSDQVILTSMSKEQGKILIRFLETLGVDRPLEIQGEMLSIFKRAIPVNFLGDELGRPVEIKVNKLEIPLRPRKIMTLHLE